MSVLDDISFDDLKENLLKMVAMHAVVIDKYVTLDMARRDGEITDAEFADKFGAVMDLPIIGGMITLTQFGTEIVEYIDSAEEALDTFVEHNRVSETLEEIH